MEDVRELLDQLNKFSVIDASKYDKEVLLENDIKATYRIKGNSRYKDLTFQAVLYITLGNSEPITWGCINEEENHEVVKWFELKEASLYKKKQAQRDRDTQILKSLIKL
tara:strand:+ start:2788 stop:3114 length:327 start_codon:yes stop_codon:yes gene_type:complete